MIVIRYEGPKGGQGCGNVVSNIGGYGQRAWERGRVITDGRFSGGTHGFVVGHVTPEAYDGGVIAIIEDGDDITINAETQEVNLHVDQATIDARLSHWKRPLPNYTSGVLKYAAQ